MAQKRSSGIIVIALWLLSVVLFVALFITYHDTPLSRKMGFPGMPLYGAMTWWFFLTIPVIGYTWGWFNDLKSDH